MSKLVPFSLDRHPGCVQLGLMLSQFVLLALKLLPEPGLLLELLLLALFPLLTRLFVFGLKFVALPVEFVAFVFEFFLPDPELPAFLFPGGALIFQIRLPVVEFVFERLQFLPVLLDGLPGLLQLFPLFGQSAAFRFVLLLFPLDAFLLALPFLFPIVLFLIELLLPVFHFPAFGFEGLFRFVQPILFLLDLGVETLQILFPLSQLFFSIEKLCLPFAELVFALLVFGSALVLLLVEILFPISKLPASLSEKVAQVVELGESLLPEVGQFLRFPIKALPLGFQKFEPLAQLGPIVFQFRVTLLEIVFALL